jgi:PAS domain S-box-containing protein
MILESKMAIVLAYGPDLNCVYNGAYRLLLGRMPEALGRPFYEVWPGARGVIESDIEQALLGKGTFSKNAAIILNRHTQPEEAFFDYSLSPVRDDEGRIAGVICHCTETTGHVLAVRNQAFLIKLEEVLWALRDPVAVMAAAAEMLGRHLRVGRCGYARIDEKGEFAIIEKDWTDGTMQSAAGRHRLDEVGSELAADFRAGHTVRVEDALSDTRIGSEEAATNFAVGGMRAHLSVPLSKDERFVAALYVHDRVPRQWTDSEEALVRQVAARTWAVVERARAKVALLESEERWRSIFERLHEGFFVGEVVRDASGRIVDWRIIEVNPACERMVGIPRASAIGRTVRDIIPGIEDEWVEEFARVVETGEATSFMKPVRVLDRWYGGHAFRIGPERFASLFFDVTERRRMERVLRESEERLRLALDVGRMGAWDWNLKTGEIAWSDEVYRIQGYAVGAAMANYEAWAAHVHPDDLPGAEAAMAQARDGRQDYVCQFRMLLPDGTVRWCSERGRYFYEGDQAVRMIGVMEDVTERRQWEEKQQVLIAELQHRTRNLIAVIHSISHQTMAGASSFEEFEERFSSRLLALSRVQGLLSRADEQPISIGALVRTELEALGATHVNDRVVLEGPTVKLRNSVVQTIALALHELSTNALKYGALGTPDGHLSVSWHVYQAEGGERCLALQWVERDVDMQRWKETPARIGYGRQLIEEALPYQLGARTRFEMGEDGVRCSIDLPLGKRNGKKGAA